MDGFTDPVAVHPDFRRRGIARALMLSGFGLLKAMGATRARLGTSSEKLGMQAAAESVGYRLEGAMLWFSKEIEPDRD
jgi:ribosomal protein S18 acetylase RimI-like enzyme